MIAEIRFGGGPTSLHEEIHRYGRQEGPLGRGYVESKKSSSEASDPERAPLQLRILTYVDGVV